MACHPALHSTSALRKKPKMKMSCSGIVSNCSGTFNMTMVALLLFLGTMSCRGWISESPPVHPNPNMDTQHKYKPFGKSTFFDDKRTLRPRVAGTVARGELKLDEHFSFGTIDGKPASGYPKQLKVDKEFVLVGQQKFNALCSHCHDHAGSGQGLVGARLPVKPSSFHTDYLRAQPEGHFFDVIMNGVRTMPKHGYMLSEIEAWHIVSYIRSLQLSQDARVAGG